MSLPIKPKVREMLTLYRINDTETSKRNTPEFLMNI